MRSFNSLGLWDLVLRELDTEEAEGRERSRETGWTLLSGLDSSPPPAQLAPSPSPGDLPDPGIKLGSAALQADSLPVELPGKPLCESSFTFITKG